MPRPNDPRSQLNSNTTSAHIQCSPFQRGGGRVPPPPPAGRGYSINPMNGTTASTVSSTPIIHRGGVSEVTQRVLPGRGFMQGPFSNSQISRGGGLPSRNDGGRRAFGARMLQPLTMSTGMPGIARHQQLVERGGGVGARGLQGTGMRAGHGGFPFPAALGRGSSGGQLVQPLRGSSGASNNSSGRPPLIQGRGLPHPHYGGIVRPPLPSHHPLQRFPPFTPPLPINSFGGRRPVHLPPPPPPPPPHPMTLPSNHINYNAQQNHATTFSSQATSSTTATSNGAPHGLRPAANSAYLTTPLSAPSVQHGNFLGPQLQQGYVPASIPSSQSEQQPQQALNTQEQIVQAWSEHEAPNGMKYYYNSLTKESTYNKPEVLKKVQVDCSDWKTYLDPVSGKTYYSNGTTTSWEKPTTLATDLAATKLTGTATTSKIAGNSIPTSSSTANNETQDDDSVNELRKKKKRKRETEFNSKEEAVAAFKGLLLAKDIAPSLKWNEVVKICSSDARWEDCEDVLSSGERKQALAEYQTKRANELRTIERQERARAKDMFVKMLSEILPLVEGFSAWNSRYADIRASLSKDDRFHAVADEPARENLFVDFCEEFRKRDERTRRSKRHEAQDAFLTFLREKHEDGMLTYASTWKNFKLLFDERESPDYRFSVSTHMSDEDRQLYFADFVIELQAVEDDKRRRIRDSEQRAEHEQRDAFRASLAELAVQGKLLPASRWRNIDELVMSLHTFAPVQAQDCEAPREIFEAFVHDWNNVYRRDRTFLSQLVFPSSKSDALVKNETSYEEFVKALLERASDSSEHYKQARKIISEEDPVSSARLYFNELSMRSRGLSGPAIIRRGRSMRRKDSDSSEDEGEIIEDGELPDMMK